MVNIFKSENRLRIQALGALVFNGNLKGFVEGKIYRGPTKGVCVPVLNCYSCPGALGACPIGSLQAVYGNKKFSFYVLGLMILFGISLGRLFCGFLCPFGLFQDLLYKIKCKKIKIKKSIHNKLKYIKYLNLFLLVMILPFGIALVKGYSSPYFCKYVCPAGILEGAIPLMTLNKGIRMAAGNLFLFKSVILILVIVFSVLNYRVFCKYICPLGAFYGLFNKVSMYKLSVDENKCIKCNRCTHICKMHIEPYKTPNNPECIRCLDCKKVCPTKAIESEFKI